MANEITAPLRLATGSHEAGSGRGCAMNVISWENGDARITDYPACSARPLARLVQGVNDGICSHTADSFLCPECSALVLRLGHSTVGTAGATREQILAWLAELLDSSWGLTATVPDCPATVRETADLLRRTSSGAVDANAYAAYAAYAAAAAAAYSAVYVAYAARAAAYAAYAANAAAAAAAAVRGTANAAASVASYAANAARAPVAHCEAAIAAWHKICGTSPAAPSPEVTREAVSKMLAKSVPGKGREEEGAF